jgi:excisionase family DNA binding protein
VSDFDRDDVEGDPWLTVAEIAEELRVNPATVRLWVSKGTLPATRAGQRKLLIRRSDLDRMLEAIRLESPPVGRRSPRKSHPRYRNRPPVLQSIRQLSTADIHGHRVSPAEMQEIVEALQLAD